MSTYAHLQVFALLVEGDAQQTGNVSMFTTAKDTRRAVYVERDLSLSLKPDINGAEVCMYICTHVCLYMHVYTYMYMCIYVCIYICTHLYTYMYVYIHICIFMYINMYVYI